MSDFKFSLRALRRSPLFTVTALLSLALGIGANTAIFTLLDQLLLRLLPVKDPAQLVMIWTTDPQMGSNWGPRQSSYPLHQDFQRKAQAFSSVGSDKPVLLLYDTASGHSGGRPVKKQIEEQVDELSYLYWQLGVAE